MTPWIGPVFLRTAAAYLLGSVSFAVVLVRLFRGQDVRTVGSGNAGATNVLRNAGSGLAFATLTLDALKGSAAVLLARGLGPGPEGLCAVAVIFGHVFPVWFGFRGGKGVATAVGAFGVLMPLPVLTVTGVFAVVVALTRMVSAASLTAALLLPPVAQFAFRAPAAYVLAAAATTALLVLSHRENVRRLLHGSERRLGRGKDVAE